jgi:two-component system, OmpR family, sensor histidine kinase CiaH
MYTAILAAVVAVLSASVYELHWHDVGTLERRGERRQGERAIDGDLPALEPRAGFAEYLERLGRSILLADLVTICVGGGLSAFLAGRTLRPIRQAVEAEKAFFTNAAHDLRTPLAVMRSEAEVALRGGHALPPEARQVIASSLEEITHMSAMVEQMLDLARSGRRNIAAVTRLIDIAALARGMVEKMAPRADKSGVRLVVEAAGQVLVRGDPVSLQRALGNVLENSMAYTPRGGSVVLRVQRTGGSVTLQCEDTGVGIAAEDLPRITEAFFRGDPARQAHAGGAGLGLTIVKTIVDEHGGTFSAESLPGRGTTITLRFPSR